MPVDSFECPKKVRKSFSVYFLVVGFLSILFFGLNPRVLSFANHVYWIKNQSGIRFEKNGIAYTNVLNENIGGDISDLKTFSVEIALRLENTHKDGFKFIFALHNGQDISELLMAQWRSWIILMNRDDYAHKRKTKRIAVDTALLSAGPMFLTVTTNNHGTKIYFDGRLVEEKTDLVLDFPTKGKVKLVLGNSVYGKNSWQGDIYGLAFYQSTLAIEEVRAHFEKWSKLNNFSFAKTDKPFILFLFDEKEGRWASDSAGGKHSLQIPEKMGTLERKFLGLPRQDDWFNASLIVDIFLNVLGFVPFGFFLSATLADLGGNFRKYGISITVGLCLMLSLSIEVIQAWLPSRDSSLLDLIFNVLGGWVGSKTYRSRCGHLYDELIQTLPRQLLFQ